MQEYNNRFFFNYLIVCCVNYLVYLVHVELKKKYNVLSQILHHQKKSIAGISPGGYSTLA